MRKKIISIILIVALILLFVIILGYVVYTNSYAFPINKPIDPVPCTPYTVDKEESVEEDEEITIEYLCHDFMADYYSIVFIDSETPINYLSEDIEDYEEFQQVVETEEISETLFYSSEDIRDSIHDNPEYSRSVLIHILFFEVCGDKTEEDIKEQRAVISVIFNRLLSREYERCSDIEDIVFFRYPNGSCAYTPAENKERFWNFANENEKKDFERNYSQLAEKVDYVINNGCTVPKNVFYSISRNSYETKPYWRNNHTVYAVYDDTVFLS